MRFHTEQIIVLFDELDSSPSIAPIPDLREMGRATSAVLKVWTTSTAESSCSLTTNLFESFDKA